MADAQNTVPLPEVPVTPPTEAPVAPQAEVPVAPQVGTPVAAQAQVSSATVPPVTYLKRPFYKLAWFWIALGLAVVCFCLMAGIGGLLISGRVVGRESRVNPAQMKMEMRNGRPKDMNMNMNGEDPGCSMSTETTSVPKGQKRMKVQPGATYVQPGAEYVQPGALYVQP